MPLDRTSSRVETGPVQFGEDWPGVFIRGDNAVSYAMHLQALLDFAGPFGFCDGFSAIQLRGLQNLLASCCLADKVRDGLTHGYPEKPDVPESRDGDGRAENPAAP